MPVIQLLVNLLPLILGICVKYGFFKKRGFGKDYLAGLTEGLKTVHKCKKVKYRPENLVNYLSIQWELIAGTFLYVWEFSRRKLLK